MCGLIRLHTRKEHVRTIFFPAKSGRRWPHLLTYISFLQVPTSPMIVTRWWLANVEKAGTSQFVLVLADLSALSGLNLHLNFSHITDLHAVVC